MAVTPKAYRTNIIRDSSVVVSSLNEQASFPSSWVKDQMRTKRMRTKVGWTVGAGYNDEVVFTTADGTRRAHVAPGNYATGAAMATAVQTAMGVGGLDPLQVGGGLTGWYRADNVSVDASGNVQTWPDMSGGGHDLTQATANLRPLLVANAFGGRPGIYFNNTASMALASSALMSAFLGAGGIGTMVVVCKLDSDAASNDLLCGINDVALEAALYWSGSNNFTAQTNDGSSHTAAHTSAAGSFALQTVWWRYDKSNIQSAASNADDAGFTSTVATGNISNLGTAGFRVGSDATNALKGYIMEVIIFNTALTQSPRRQLQQYILGRYPSETDTSTVFAWTVTMGCTYDSTAKKFTISRTGGAGNPSLLCNSSTPTADNANQAYADLGYSTAADKTGSTSYLADTVSYQGRHWLKANLPNNAATQYSFMAILDDNISSSGSVLFRTNSIDLWRGLSSTSLGTQSLDGNSTFATFSAVAAAWWRLEVNDVTNSLGYVEIGFWDLGLPDVATAMPYDTGYQPVYDDFSQPQYGPYGALHEDERPQRRVWNLSWSNLLTADYNTFVTFWKMTPIGRAFFFAFDTTGDSTNLVFVELAAPLKLNHKPNTNNLWQVSMSIREVLG